MADFEEAIRLKPDYAAAYDSRGQAYFILGEFNHALNDFQKTLALEPDDKYATAGLALTQHALGDLEEARRLWQEKLMSLDANFSDVEWVGRELNWHPKMIEAARKLLQSL